MTKAVKTLDRIDMQILEELQADGRLTMAELAARISLSQSPCWRRVQLLEQAGYIQGYHARLNRKLLGFGVHGFVNLQVRDSTAATSEALERAIAGLAGVIACHNISGPDDYQIELAAADHETFAKLVLGIRAFPGISHIRTSFTLREVRVEIALPIG